MSNSVPEISRRVALGTMATAGLAFVAFGPRGTPEQVGNRLVLEYWEKWTGHEAAAMQRIIDAFNDSQDRIYVRFFSMSGIDQKSMIAIAGGKPPDIIGLWNFNIPAYAESGAIEPLDELAEAAGIRRDRYVESLWPLLTHRGRLYSAVSTCGSVAMFYNRSILRDAGLDPERPPRTIEELDDMSERLTIREGDGRLRRVGFMQSHPGWWLWQWGYHFGGNLLDQEANEVLADSAENVAGYEWVARTAERFGGRNAETFRSGFGAYSSPQNAFLEGRVAMVQQGPWLANVIDAFRPDMDYAVAPFPVAESVYGDGSPAGLLDADVLVIPKGAKDPEASMEFIAFVQREEHIASLSAAHCKNAPLRDMPESFYANHKHRFVRVHDAIANSPRAYHFPRTRAWPQYQDAMHTAFYSVWSGRSSPLAALEGVKESVQARLDDIEHKRSLREGVGT
ncbi:MAG: ABC transporter substrate-binding protein [Planctomycetota bacterium]